MEESRDQQQKVESPTSNRPSLGSVDRLLATAPPLLGISLPPFFKALRARSLGDSNPKLPISGSC